MNPLIGNKNLLLATGLAVGWTAGFCSSSAIRAVGRRFNHRQFAAVWDDILPSRRRRHSLRWEIEAEISRRVASGELVRCTLIKNDASTGPAPDQPAP